MLVRAACSCASERGGFGKECGAAGEVNEGSMSAAELVATNNRDGAAVDARDAESYECAQLP